MVVKNCVVQKLNVERRPTRLICTQAEDIAFID